MQPIRAGIVGAGFAANYHVECLERVHGVHVEIAGVTSLRKESREAFAAQRGLKAFDSVEDMLDSIDLLDICSPPYAHQPQALAALRAGKHVLIEKPLTGCFGPADDAAQASFYGNQAPKQPMLDAVMQSMGELRDAADKAGVVCGYAENFVYAPSVQKERDVLEKTGAQILRMLGEESHNGSASPVYGIWKFAGGGSLVGKGCHPYGAILYLKRVEGLTRTGQPLRPATVSARIHEITRLPNYDDKGFIRTDYRDIEDYGFMHITFDDGTVADVLTCEMVLGGIYDYLEVFANNHRVRCRLNPNDLMDLYTPDQPAFQDVYTVEKISTKIGWSPCAPDENFTMGYYWEMQDFLECAANGVTPQCDLGLGIDCMSTVYAAYVSAEKKGAEVEIPRIA